MANHSRYCWGWGYERNVFICNIDYNNNNNNDTTVKAYHSEFDSGDKLHNHEFLIHNPKHIHTLCYLEFAVQEKDTNKNIRCPTGYTKWEFVGCDKCNPLKKEYRICRCEKKINQDDILFYFFIQKINFSKKFVIDNH